MRTTILTLCLVLLAGSAWAVPVDPNAPDGVAAIYDTWILFTDGKVLGWDVGSGIWKVRDPLPVSVPEIRDWSMLFIVTNDGRYFSFDFTVSSTEWTEIPSPPYEPPVSANPESIDNLKTMYR